MAAALLDLAPRAANAYLKVRRQQERRAHRHLEKLARKLQAELQEASRADEWRKRAELLTANLHRIRKGQRSIIVEDYYQNNQPLEIELDPASSAQQQAQRFFKKARRRERGQAQIASRLADVQAQLQQDKVVSTAESCLHDWPGALEHAPEAWNTLMPRKLRVTSLWSPGGPVWETSRKRSEKSQETPGKTGPGRTYQLPGGWEARVGRNNQDNDELTHRFAKPNDIWLHAHGSAGSHVVLRMEGRQDNPPKKILKIATALAARFSKAKHASLVPVIWTRKRYVRKPRRSPAGLAVCSHEKTLFVAPSLPPESPDAETRKK